MPLLNVFLGIFLCSSHVMTETYEDSVPAYYDSLDNDIPETQQEATPIPCSSKELTKWDKLFSMLENSQMKENMLLQYVDDIIKVELQSIRTEMLQFMANYAGTCTNVMENINRRTVAYVDRKLTQMAETIKDTNAEHQTAQEEALQQLIEASQSLANKLNKLEGACENGAHLMGLASEFKQQEVTVSTKLGNAVNILAQDLQKSRSQPDLSQMWATQHFLPSGCEVALLFPMRSKKIFASISPEAAMTLQSFTVCVWAKVTEALNKTILFSYGTKRNPYEIQLYLSQKSVVFTVGGEGNSVKSRDVVVEGQWGHFCGSWSSEDGAVSLWKNGDKVTDVLGVAPGHTIPDGGIMQLGQEKNGCCTTSLGITFDDKLAFSGKMTGVNLWDKVLEDGQIAELAREDDSCRIRGNMVGWGVTEIVPHGGAQYVN
ncbi:pentraxin-related protein PTX3 isoform X2 [Amia ocellicauda]|uniref:pentraxin-related protein PTX3 isoform X2 n=1 Tax=Amia ocellicauda TaxID=2972642 RepID=UPI003464E1B4